MRLAFPVAPLALLTLAAIPATAQETPAEKTAAADVIRRMGELERSLALPPLVARLAGARDPRRDAVIARARDLMDRELLAMADDITRHPETGWKEERSVKILADYLTAHGFAIEMGVAGLKTAFVARYTKGTPGGAGGPNLGIIVEYDALRGTSRDFHGDQHSAQGPVGLAAAVAVSEFLTSSKTPGTVTVYGTPAEELASPAAKTVMYKAGVFKGADVLIRSHSSTATQDPGPGFGSCCMNINVVHYTFSGAPAHQLQAWDGRDALMGVIELFNHIDGLRKTLRPETKIQGIITEGGKAPNVVPDRAAAEFWIRYPDPVYLAQVSALVNDAARGAALATGTKVRIELDSSSRNGISVAALNDLAFAYLKKLGATKVDDSPGRPLPFEETGTVATQSPVSGSPPTARTVGTTRSRWKPTRSARWATTGSWWTRRPWRRCCITSPPTRRTAPRSSANSTGCMGCMTSTSRPCEARIRSRPSPSRRGTDPCAPLRCSLPSRALSASRPCGRSSAPFPTATCTRSAGSRARRSRLTGDKSPTCS